MLHSSALRRLGAKTQVLGPTAGDFIRTRLTHTLEVAQIGRSLAKILGADEDLVETACLCHDLGHPPFGHNGESALAEVAKDIGGFEGNAQTLRLIGRLEPKRFFADGTPAGLNLTRASVDATMKYPWGKTEGRRKFGFYESDAALAAWAHEDHGEVLSAEAQMMDLADDIAYSVHDLEDAVVRGRVPLADLQRTERDRIIEDTAQWYGVDGNCLDSAFDRIVPLLPTEFSGTQGDLAQLKDLTSDLIGRFINAAAEASPPSLRYEGGVHIPQEFLDEILFLKGVAVTYVMGPRESEPTYLSQRSVVFDLVDALWENPEAMEPPYLAARREAEDEAGQLRAVVDQVAALTDLSAMAWHARLCGMLRSGL